MEASDNTLMGKTVQIIKRSPAMLVCQSYYKKFITQFAIGLLLGGMLSAQAAILQDEKDLGWYAHRDLTSSQFADYFAKYSEKKMMMIDMDAYPVHGELRYSMIWQSNPDDRGWYEYRDMTSTEYHNKWADLASRGYRPLDVENYILGTKSLWAGIWVQNVEGWGWVSKRNLTSAEHAQLFADMARRGYRIIDIEVHNTSGGLRYSSIWYENVDGRAWVQLRDMTRQEYQEHVDNYARQGLYVVDFESYGSPSGQLYAAIWEPKPGFAWQVRSDRTEQEYTNLWYQYADAGYRLIDFERYDTDEGTRYAGIWAENDDRFQYSRKTDLDNAITQYSTTNNLPGISVVIIDNGNMLYRRGFGFADVDDNVKAHSKTVYSAASVSKVIGATLAAKLEDEGQLSDGTEFTLDLTQPTADYITGLPNHHTHTVDQLLSHLSCMGHYNEIPNQTTHYSNATDAVQSIWNTALLAGCNPGNSWNYSTPAFTFVGAVLEGATGATLNDLFNNELFGPYGLTSMRVQYKDANLPANRLRATPYATQDAVHTPGTTDFADPPHPVSNPNVESSYSDNSWKVIGGGIETSTYDLARFGWKVLNAEILSANARDNRLWTQVNPAFTHGLGWSITTDNAGRNTAEWNGAWTGSRTFLRAYQDDGLVIAVMTNRTTHRTDLSADVGNLTNTLGNIVLAP